MKYIVYQTVNKQNGKLYIGVHKTDNPDKFDGYIGNGIYVGYSLENPKTAYQHALKKYGYDSFIRTTLKIFNTEEEAYDYEAQLVTLDFVMQDNNYNIKTGGIHGSWNYKNIYQYSLKGELIKKWNCVSDIIEQFSCCPERIRQAISNKYSTFDFYWSYFDNINVEEYRISRSTYIYQFTFKGELVNVYKTINDVLSTFEDITKNSINEAINKGKLYKEYYWLKNPDSIFNVIKINQLYNLRNRQISVYDKTGKYIEQYISMRKAADDLNISYGTIKSAIKLGSLVHDTYYFSYDKLDIFVPYSGNPVVKKKVGQYDYNTGELIKVWETISECAKIHPKCRDVIKGGRNHTHGYTFKYIE